LIRTKSRTTPLRVWPHVATFLTWGMALSFLQWGAERSAALLWLSERLATALGYGLGGMVHLPAQVDGRVIKLYGTAQEVTPNCFGLAAITFLVAALLATPAGWLDRLRGVGLGLMAMVLANVVRLVVLSWFFAYAFFAFGFVHIPIWGTVVPLFLVGVWGLWLVRDLRWLPRFPLKFAGFVALLLVPLLGAWYLVLDGYIVVLVLGVNDLLTVLGVPIETVRLASVDLFRYVDVGLAGGGFRIEVAAQTLNLVPYLALILASPLALGRRLLLSLYGTAALVGLHAAGTAAVIFLGWSAPPLVTPFQIVNDFLSLGAGPSLWFVLARPSPAWFHGSAEVPGRELLLRETPDAVPVGRRRLDR
jgi:exosortase/archaeosortase family protein